MLYVNLAAPSWHTVKSQSVGDLPTGQSQLPARVLHIVTGHGRAPPTGATPRHPYLLLTQSYLIFLHYETEQNNTQPTKPNDTQTKHEIQARREEIKTSTGREERLQKMTERKMKKEERATCLRNQSTLYIGKAPAEASPGAVHGRVWGHKPQGEVAASLGLGRALNSMAWVQDTKLETPCKQTYTIPWIKVLFTILLGKEKKKINAVAPWWVRKSKYLSNCSKEHTSALITG